MKGTIFFSRGTHVQLGVADQIQNFADQLSNNFADQ